MKKLVWVLVVSLFVLGMTPVFAAVTVDDKTIAKAQAIVDQANAEIDRLVNVAVEAANYTNDAGDQAIADALVKSTNKIAKEAVKDSKKLGVEVGCTLTETPVGSVVVWIDPLFVCDD